MNISCGNEISVKKHFTIREEGTLLLRCKCSYTTFPDAKKYNTLYEMMWQNCERWATQVLGEKIRREFLDSNDSMKRFHFPCYEYSFSSYISGENADMLCVITDATLLRRGQKSPVEFRRTSQLWRKSDLALLPDSTLLPKKKSRDTKALLKKHPVGFFLRDNDLFAFGGVSDLYWEEKLV